MSSSVGRSNTNSTAMLVALLGVVILNADVCKLPNLLDSYAHLLIFCIFYLNKTKFN